MCIIVRLYFLLFDCLGWNLIDYVLKYCFYGKFLFEVWCIYDEMFV